MDELVEATSENQLVAVTAVTYYGDTIVQLEQFGGTFLNRGLRLRMLQRSLRVNLTP